MSGRLLVDALFCAVAAFALSACQGAVPAAATPTEPPAATPFFLPLPLPTETPLPVTQAAPSTATHDPGGALSMYRAGVRNFEQRNYAAAVNDFSLAIVTDKKYAEAYCARGLAYAALSDPQSAYIDFEAGLQIDPALAACYVGRAQIYVRDNDVPKALQDLAQAQSVQPDYADTYLVRGRIYRDDANGDSAQALSDFGRVVALAPQRIDGYMERADLYLQLQQPDRALADLNVAIVIDPQNARAYYLRGAAREALGDPRSALADLQKAQSLGFADEPLFVMIGRSYLDISDLPHAIEAFDSALALKPDDVQTHYLRGLANYQGAHNYPALLDANAVLQAQPDHEDGLALRANIYLNLQRWDDAVADFKHVYALDPNNVDALFGLAVAYAGQHRDADAIVALKEYIQKAPPDAANLRRAQQMLALLQSGDVTVTPTPGS